MCVITSVAREAAAPVSVTESPLEFVVVMTSVELGVVELGLLEVAADVIWLDDGTDVGDAGFDEAPLEVSGDETPCVADEEGWTGDD